MKKIFFSVFFVYFGNSICGSAQNLPPKAPYPFNIKQLHCGHSLTDPLFNPWPGQFVELIAQQNGFAGGWQAWGSLVGSATLAGAWMRFHWDTTLAWCGQDNSVACYEANMNPRFDINQWQVLVITENMEGPLALTAHQSPEHLSWFVNNTWQAGHNGAGAPTLLWTNWGGLDGSTYYFGDSYGVPGATDGSATGWRQLLDMMESGWHQMQDYANAHRPPGCPPVYIIPGNRMMARFYDDIQQGLVPGISHVNAIFSADGVHLNDLGNYMVTMIHYACLFNQSPVGLPHTLMSGTNIPPAFAQYVQHMVWDVVTHYPRSGLTHLASISQNRHGSLKIFPNPTKGPVFLSVEGESPISTSMAQIFDISGQCVGTFSGTSTDLSWLAPGLYVLQYKGYTGRLLKL
ncbi:MAG: T9SS type A sorting domain-containing protein [Flavobacteriales bacterium]|nr:T9SS type A sorting domain-containing protein [Flavobacteriales bacterium]MCX7650425.1 T9SS type A sorting domain-containing protein [Flavobacteriales bacterium]MDW8432041.1 T9SS type A sorting domain-containing protein [Flavobacteriales bacterium]